MAHHLSRLTQPVRRQYSAVSWDIQFDGECLLAAPLNPLEMNFDAEAHVSQPTVDPFTQTAAIAKHPKIRKPSGEVGRPARGGYTLADVLEWDDNLYDKVQVRLLL